MTIQVQLRNVYGRELIYPINDAAKLAVGLTGRKTFTEADLQLLSALGLKVEWVSALIPIPALKTAP